MPKLTKSHNSIFASHHQKEYHNHQQSNPSSIKNANEKSIVSTLQIKLQPFIRRSPTLNKNTFALSTPSPNSIFLLSSVKAPPHPRPMPKPMPLPEKIPSTIDRTSHPRSREYFPEAGLGARIDALGKQRRRVLVCNGGGSQLIAARIVNAA